MKKIATILLTLIISLLTVITTSAIVGSDDGYENRVSRQEWETWKASFQNTLDNLEYNCVKKTQQILQTYEEEGRLDDIQIWITATQSNTRKSVKTN